MGDEDHPAAESRDETAESRPEDVTGETDLQRTSSGDDGLTPRERRQLRLQRQRERRIWTGLAGAGLVVLLLFLLAFWPVMAGRLNAAKQLDEAQALLGQASSTMAPLDKLVSAQLSPAAAGGVPSSAAQILVARRELNQALALVDDAMPHLTEDEQKRGELIRTAAKARLVMINRAPAILAASAKAVDSKSLVDRAWELTLHASASEIAASSNYGLGKASAVESASVSLQRVKGQLGDARSLYSQAASAFPGLDFERYVAYVDVRRQGVALLSQAAAQWLEGDVVGAAASHAAYERSVAKASAAVAKLPSAPGAPGRAFRIVAGPAADAYAHAKQQALDAEKALGTP